MRTNIKTRAKSWEAIMDYYLLERRYSATLRMDYYQVIKGCITKRNVVSSLISEFTLQNHALFPEIDFYEKEKDTIKLFYYPIPKDRAFRRIAVLTCKELIERP